MSLVTVFDSAAGEWPLEGDGSGGNLLVYADPNNWGGNYNGVHYPNNLLLAQAKFPKAHLIQINSRTPNQAGFDVYDVEDKCLTVAEACALANTDVIHGRKPCLYGSVWTFGATVTWLRDNYSDRILGRDIGYWLADPGGLPTPEPGDWAVQYRWGPNEGPDSYNTSAVLSTAPFLVPGDA